MMRALLLALALLVPASVQAHLLPPQNATINLVGNSAFNVVSVPVSAFHGVDVDRNGRLSARELQTGLGAIGIQFKERFRLAQDGVPGRSDFAWVMNPYTEGFPPQGLDYVVVMQRVDFAQVAARPMLTTDLFGSAPGTRQMTITATHGEAREIALLDATRTRHGFFRGALAVFGDFVWTGAEHILLGADHLLFLLTVIVAAQGWRYWLGVVTSFTLAHSITLTLSALDLVQLSPRIVEPAIAASIVGMAIVNLFARQAHPRARVALVFGCGLLHGLGFASAFAELGLDQQHRVASLAGFNIGVELGQFAFLATILGAGVLIRRVIGKRWMGDLAWLASAVAATFGTVLLLART